ncbi:MAG: hypothetical protein KDB14_09350 [Planctomycetales bacterium]|nr:hypothetical protein [Planctomycetales bacterium]
MNAPRRWLGPRRPDALQHREHALLAGIDQRVERFRELSDAELLETSQSVKALVCSEGVDAPRAITEAFALASESLCRTHGIRLYPVQLLAALVLARGGIAEMQTGEGKTYSCFPAALLHALTGRGVHVATTSAYLAERDAQLVAPAYQQLGLSVGVSEEQGSTAAKQSAYAQDVTYATGHEFGFDYLRDQLELRKRRQAPLGEPLIDLLSEPSRGNGQLLQRGLYYAIVDEADSVMLDDALSPLVLSGSVGMDAPDADIHRAARIIVTQLWPEHYETRRSGATQLTPSGIDWIHQPSLMPPTSRLLRTWTEYLDLALRANSLRRDVDYIVDSSDAVQIVDTGTGRIFSDRTWRDGLHQAVEAKEGVRITSERESLAQITRQRFARLYQRLAGMTGTAVGCEREFRQVYGLQVQPIPLRTPSLRELWPMRAFASQRMKWRAIEESVAELHAQQRPVLIGTSSIADSEQLAALFTTHGLPFQLLNGRQDADEAAIVALAGQLGAITIATSLAGRGTDIHLGDGVASRGGLHVVVAECGASQRVDRQLVGRCARQGDPGSSQTFISAEDALITQHGRWLARFITSRSNDRGELQFDLTAQIRKIQRAADRVAAGARATLLRNDRQ